MTLLNLHTEAFIVAMCHALRDMDNGSLQEFAMRDVAYVGAGLQQRSFAEFNDADGLALDMLPTFDREAFMREKRRRRLFGISIQPKTWQELKATKQAEVAA
jgi:hypothetical protein